MRGWIGARLRAAVLVSAAAAGGAVAGGVPPLDGMGAARIAAFQQRLQSLGCYRGAVDGVASDALRDAFRACPDQTPVLRLETHKHTAPPGSVAADAACRIAATGAADKTVRLWSLPDGRPLRVQRLPIGQEDEGEVYAVAISPDGSVVAAGGWDAFPNSNGVYLFDAAAGTAMRRIGDLEDVIHTLAFSPDGARLAVGTERVDVFETRSGRRLFDDADFSDSVHGLAFGPDGALYAAARDGLVRRYARGGERTQKVTAAAGKTPHMLAVSPDGRRVAVGFADSDTPVILDGETLERLATADAAGLPDDNSSRLGWSADGRLFMSGDTGDASLPARTFDASGRRLRDVPLASAWVLDMKPCGAGVIYSAYEPALALVGGDGRAAVLARSDAPDMRGKRGGALQVSADGTRVRFGRGPGERAPILFDLATGTVTPDPARTGDLAGAITGTLPVERWDGHSGPRLAGRPLPLKAGEIAQALAIRPDRSGFVLGSRWKLRAFSSEGVPLWPAPLEAPGPVGGLALARDGALIVAAYEDGTIRWHRWSDGRELLALFVDRENLGYVAWTPQGTYMTSPGGAAMLGWHLNRNWTQPAEFRMIAETAGAFERPDRVRTALDEPAPGTDRR